MYIYIYAYIYIYINLSLSIYIYIYIYLRPTVRKPLSASGGGGLRRRGRLPCARGLYYML